MGDWNWYRGHIPDDRDIGYRLGHEDGYHKGYEDVVEKRKKNNKGPYSECNDDEWTHGYQEGYEFGYDEGYEDALKVLGDQ